MSFQFAINHYLCPYGEPLGSFLERLQAQGFHRVGLTERAFEEAGSCEIVTEELSARGMTVSSINSAGFFLAEGEQAIWQTARNTQSIRWTRAFDGGVLNVIVGGSPLMPLSEARNRATEGLLRFAEEAADSGVRLVLEPLNVLNVQGKSCVNTISQVEALFEVFDRKNIAGISLNLDLFHLWWDPDLDKLLAGSSIPIGLLQVCDVIQDPHTLLPRRVPLDEGGIDWRGAIEAVQRNFPNAEIELELFASQLPGRDVDQILAAAKLALNGKGGMQCPF